MVYRAKEVIGVHREEFLKVLDGLLSRFLERCSAKFKSAVTSSNTKTPQIWSWRAVSTCSSLVEVLKLWQLREVDDDEMSVKVRSRYMKLSRLS